MRVKTSPLFEIAGVLLRLGHVVSEMNADHSIKATGAVQGRAREEKWEKKNGVASKLRKY